MKISKINTLPADTPLVFLAFKSFEPDKSIFSKKEREFIKAKIDKKSLTIINQYNRYCYILAIDETTEDSFGLNEKIRKEGNSITGHLNKNDFKKVIVINDTKNTERLYALIEGMALGNYQFLRYFTNPDVKKNSLKEIGVKCENTSKPILHELSHVLQGVKNTRDLINEPLSFLTAPQLALEIKKLAPKAGFNVEVFDKKKIEALKMGGLLAVNKGSIDPPTFTTIEWKPENASNKQPFVLVGKGVVYDTGGLSLKPTANSMDFMKSDMSGAAAVIGTMYAVAASKLPIHVVGLIPATDNRPDGNAYAPGDVIKMHDGSTVEVLNTDAEGRMLLADALSYAKRFKPEMVIDIATLTGASAHAVGPYAVSVMGNNTEIISQLKETGMETYERMVEFPLWSEYGEMIKSDIADIKNIGGKSAGMITAGKFLEHFTDYPWAHIDIAGNAFTKSSDSYRGKGATGFGVRLLFHFLKKKA